MLTFELPMPPNLANARLHWAERDRARRAYESTLYARRLKDELPRPPLHPFPRARLVVTLHVCGRLMDTDNAYARCKWPVDFLTRSRYVVDDSPDVLTLEVGQQRVPHRDQVKLVMTLYGEAA